MPDKRKVTIRPPLTREDDARLDYIAKINDIPKERAAAALLRRGISLTETGDEMLKRILKEESSEYRTARSDAKKGVKVRKLKKHTATIIGG